MRGSILDLAGILLIICVLLIGSFIPFKFYEAFKERYAEMNVSEQEQRILEKGESSYSVLLSAIPLIIIGAGIGAIILAFLIPSHPIFLPISILALAIFIVLSTVFSNFLFEFLSSTAIIDIANKFPLIASMVQYLPYVIAVFGAILIIVMYSKSGGYE